LNNRKGLLRRYRQDDLNEMHAKAIRFQVIRQREQLPSDVVRPISDAEERTRKNDRLALKYGG
jgi:undecaprenyl pyrophosphate synthase